VSSACYDRLVVARVVFVGMGLEAEVPVGSSILDAARAAGAPEGNRCGGVRACSTCHVYVESGGEHLSLASEDELELLELSARELRESSRLGCQAKLVADARVEVAISDESFREYLDANPSERARAMSLWRKAGG